MYYHVIVETKEKDKKSEYMTYYELNSTSLDEIMEFVVTPYSKKEQIYIDGRHISCADIRSLKIKSSEMSLGELCDIAQRKVPPNVFFVCTQLFILSDENYVKDITKDTLRSVGGALISDSKSTTNDAIENNKVFIIHGRDDQAKTETARFIEQLGLEAIILHEQTSSGKTIIEKIESYSKNIGFALVLYTKCDEGRLVGEEEWRHRARQNVVFEHGYLVGKLSRQRVCALVKDGVETPGDINGCVYVDHDSRGAWRMTVAKELKAAGYHIDLNKLS